MKRSAWVVSVTETFQIKEHVYKLVDGTAHPMIVLGVKRRRFNRDKYLVSKSAKDAYIEVVSADELVKAQLMRRPRQTSGPDYSADSLDQKLRGLYR